MTKKTVIILAGVLCLLGGLSVLISAGCASPVSDTTTTTTHSGGTTTTSGGSSTTTSTSLGTSTTTAGGGTTTTLATINITRVGSTDVFTFDDDVNWVLILSQDFGIVGGWYIYGTIATDTTRSLTLGVLPAGFETGLPYTALISGHHYDISVASSGFARSGHQIFTY